MFRLALTLSFCLPLLASEPVIKPQNSSPSQTIASSTSQPTRTEFDSKELGITIGTPGQINLNIGYWGTTDFPFIARISGAYWTKTDKGAQLDLGWRFHQSSSGKFRQFLAATLSAWRIHSSHGLGFNGSDDTRWIGVGPTYGFNLYGFSLQVGYSIGSGETEHTGGVFGGSNYTNHRSGTATGQLGYTFIW